MTLRDELTGIRDGIELLRDDIEAIAAFIEGMETMVASPHIHRHVNAARDAVFVAGELLAAVSDAITLYGYDDGDGDGDGQ